MTTTTERRYYRINETMDFEPGIGTVLSIEYAPCPDETAARELELWGDNAEHLYNYRQWIIKGANKAAEKGKRSEERRVGKERRCRWSAEHEEERNKNSK